MKDNFDLPPEITNIYNEYVALTKLRDVYTKLPFGLKKAIKCANNAENARERFWRKIKELYPELDGKTLVYKVENYTVSVHNEQD